MATKDTKNTPTVKRSTFIIVTSILGGLLLLTWIGFSLIFASGLFSNLGAIFSDGRLEITSGSDHIVIEGNKTRKLVDNPNSRVTVSGQRMEARDLEFYLPLPFSTLMAAGGGDEAVYTSNLLDDDGWATVEVYVEKTSETPSSYLKDFNSALKQTNSNLEISGQTWIKAENGGVTAYATKYGDYIYALVYSVKLTSSTTDKAASMIEKTLYFDKIYQ